MRAEITFKYGSRPALYRTSATSMALRLAWIEILVFDHSGKGSESGQVVFNLLKRGQHRLAVICNRPIVSCLELLDGRATLPGVEKRFRDIRAQGPHWGRPLKPLRKGEAVEASRGAQQDSGEECRPADTDLRVRLSDRPLGAGDVRSPLQEFRRKARRYGRWICFPLSFQDLECRRGLADEDRDRVFVLGAGNGQIRVLGESRM